jgi:hypothetical protein
LHKKCADIKDPSPSQIPDVLGEPAGYLFTTLNL